MRNPKIFELVTGEDSLFRWVRRGGGRIMRKKTWWDRKTSKRRGKLGDFFGRNPYRQHRKEVFNAV